jgi:hypothetical protein
MDQTLVASFNAFKLAPRNDAEVPTPASGETIYYSIEQSALVSKDSAGVVSVIGSGATPAPDPVTFDEVHAALSEANAGISVNSQRITDLVPGTDPSDAVAVSQLDSKLNTDGGTLSGSISMSGNKITALGSAESNGDAVNYGQLLTRTKLNDVITTILFGDGSDGDLTIADSGSAVTLTKDSYYDEVTISGTGYIATAGYKLYIRKLTLTNAGAGAIRYDGNAGGNASGATGGSAGAAITGVSVGSTGAGTAGSTATTGTGTAGAGVSALSLGSGGTPGGAGGGGGTGAAGAAAGGGSNSAAITTVWLGHQLHDHHLRGTTLVGGGVGGRGGSAGSGDGSSAVGGGGGGGGGGGPYLWLSVRELVTGQSTAAGAIRALGGNGGNGGNGASGNTGGGGGGGGGAGGRVDFRYQIHSGTDATALFYADGGNGGTGGNGSGTGTTGGNGVGGTAGRVSICNVTTGVVEYHAQTVAPSGVTGGQTRVDLAADASTGGYTIMAPEFNSSATRERAANFAASVTDAKVALAAATGNLWGSTTEVDTTNVDGIIVLTRSNAYYAGLPAAVRTLADGLASSTLEAFALYQQDATALYVIGNSLTGCQHGLYEVLDRLGFRWYIPGSEWTITPSVVSHRLTVSEIVEPKFRRMFSWDTWPSNLGSYPVENPTAPKTAQDYWIRRNKYTTEFHTAGHSWQNFLANMVSAPGTPMTTDPVFWAEVDGVRVSPTNPANTNNKFHSTNYGKVNGVESTTDYSSFSGTVRLFVLDRLSTLQAVVNSDPDQYTASGVSVMPSDGYLGEDAICGCAKCVNLLRNGPWQQVNADSTVSDRVFTLGCEVAKRMLGAPDMTRVAEYAQASTYLASGKTLPNATDLQDRYVLCAAVHKYTLPPNNVVILPSNFVITLNAWDTGTSNLTKKTDLETIAAWVNHKFATSGEYILVDKNFTTVTGTGDMCEPTHSPHVSHYRRKTALDNGFEGCALTSSNSGPCAGWFNWLMGRQGWYANTNATTLLDAAFTDLFGAAASTVRTMFEEFWETHNRWETTDWQLTKRNIGRAYQLLATARGQVVGQTAIETRLSRLRWYVHFLRLVYEYDLQAFEAPDSQAHLDAANAVIRWAWCCHPYGLIDAYGIQRYRITNETETISAALNSNWSTSKSIGQSPWNGCTAAAAATRATELEGGEAAYIAEALADIAHTRTTLVQPIASNAGTDYVTGTTFTNASPASTFFLAPGGEAVTCNVGVQTTTLSDTSTARVVLRDASGNSSSFDVAFPGGAQAGQWYETELNFGTLSAGQYSVQITTMSAAHYLRASFKRKIPNATWGRVRQNLNGITQYFWVPSGTTSFIVEGRFFGNTAPTIKCENTVVTPTQRYNEYLVTVGAGQDGKVWNITNTKWQGASTASGRLGAFLRLRGVPNLFSPSADQVLSIAP